jgi:hypothetical protein
MNKLAKFFQKLFTKGNVEFQYSDNEDTQEEWSRSVTRFFEDVNRDLIASLFQEFDLRSISLFGFWENYNAKVELECESIGGI